jgi:2'-5' RNA ligase
MRPKMAPPANQVRYALYFAPPPEGDLWRFGCEVIGRDAGTDAPLDGFAPKGYSPDSWRSVTSDPRRYGFHATLKAPFPLRLDLDVSDLFDTVAEFARKSAPFDAGELGVSAIAAGDGRAFVALTPEGPLKELRSFEASVVRDLDRLRGPVARAGRERLGPGGLTARQAYYGDAWGCPYVLDEFHPHFTLTNAISDAERVARLLEWEFKLRVPSRALRVDALTLFVEREPGGEFKILRRFPLGRPNRVRRSSTRVLAPAVFD